ARGGPRRPRGPPRRARGAPRHPRRPDRGGGQGRRGARRAPRRARRAPRPGRGVRSVRRGATRHAPSDPQGFTLATMAKAAREAGETWTMRQWAARLAAQAEPRDYPGQLGALFRGIVERWRYVQEPGEIVTGSGRAVLAHTLGLGPYPGVDPERVDVGALPLAPRRRGFGDCDDVATLTAAGVWALGMRPAFRVVQSPGGAHVSVTATTPTGERV